MACGSRLLEELAMHFHRILFLSSILLIAACTTTRMSHTSRTGIEQLLLSNAVDQALEKTPLPPVDGKKVYLEEKYLDCVDKGYLIGSIREKLLQAGGHLVGKPEDSEVTIEIRSGAIGTDNVDRFVGMPAIAMPGPLPISLPEVRLYERTSQFGTAKIALVAYQTATGQMIFDSGRQLARGDDSRWSIMGIGPFQTGTVRQEVAAGTNGSSIRLAGGTAENR